MFKKLSKANIAQAPPLGPSSSEQRIRLLGNEVLMDFFRKDAKQMDV